MVKDVRALRLVIYQSSANYKKEETTDNKMTYPLPPLSTIIGALHNVCRYSEYHEMDVSIQGKYETLQKIPYTDYCFLNSLQDDRGTLVKMQHKDILSNAFRKVASSQKPQGNSFRTGKTIQVHDQFLLDEYRRLKDIGDQIDQYNKKKIQPLLELIKRRKKRLLEKKKIKDKESAEFSHIARREKEIRVLEKNLKEFIENIKEEEYTIPISNYRVLITSLKYYEVLSEIKLIIHVRADEKILFHILENIDELQSIGRSEDLISLESADIVELLENFRTESVSSKRSAYLDYDLVKAGQIYDAKKGKRLQGTRYYLNKNYEIKKGKRIFHKKKVIYTSNYAVDKFENGLYLDKYNGEKLIVNFL